MIPFPAAVADVVGTGAHVPAVLASSFDMAYRMLFCRSMIWSMSATAVASSEPDSSISAKAYSASVKHHEASAARALSAASLSGRRIMLFVELSHRHKFMTCLTHFF